jgi:hypothetical protein
MGCSRQLELFHPISLGGRHSMSSPRAKALMLLLTALCLTLSISAQTTATQPTASATITKFFIDSLSSSLIKLSQAQAMKQVRFTSSTATELRSPNAAPF